MGGPLEEALSVVLRTTVLGRSTHEGVRIMATYKCSKCGLEGYSKNIRTRHFFATGDNPADRLSTIMTNIVDVSSEWSDERGQWTVTLSLPWSSANKDEPSDEVEMQALQNLQLDEETRSRWLCNHKFDHTGGVELES